MAVLDFFKRGRDDDDQAPEEPEEKVHADEYGLTAEHVGENFPAIDIIGSERRRRMQHSANYYKCRQHDHKMYNWNGAMIQPGGGTVKSIALNKPDFFIPMEQRRPGSPYRIARTIVNAFTTFCFGEDRWPLVTSEDETTADFLQGLVEATNMQSKFELARSIGGACGTVGISWGFINGKPRVRIHEGQNLYVMEWEDEDDFIPAHVIELFQYSKDRWNSATRKMETKFYWYRRDWTKVADVEFLPIEVTTGDNPVAWQVDHKKSAIHNSGKCHFVWVRNGLSTDTTTIDGESDYEGTLEEQDELDMLNSANSRGTLKNLDPTLKLKMEQETVRGALIQKGSDNSLVTGLQGDASYLEISGSAVSAGNAQIAETRRQILEACDCVIPNISEVVGNATSSVALRVVYAPMLSKIGVYRGQYGEALKRVLSGMLDAARELNVGGVVEEEFVDADGNALIDDRTGEPVVEQVQYELQIPPKVVEEAILDEEGKVTGEVSRMLIQRMPGKGRVDLKWPSYFEATPADYQTTAGALTIAAGKLISQQTAVEHFAMMMQKDATIEWYRVQSEMGAAAASQSGGMFPGTGGEVGSAFGPTVEPPAVELEPVEGEPPMGAGAGEEN